LTNGGQCPPYRRLPKRIAILGSTGSIGTSTLDVVRHLGTDYAVTVLSAHTQLDLLATQVAEFRPSVVVVTDEAADEADIRRAIGPGPAILRGAAGMVAAVQRDDVELVVAAVVGAAGLPAVLAAVEAGKTLALANKESLVVAGSILVPLARKNNVQILPVDSEHSAVFQAMAAGRLSEVRRVILTASGGPFRKTPLEQMRKATLADALNHPTWRMGSKITIDSATMFNKALEIIEACWLFDLPPDKVAVVVHPESVVHSMVEFVDGSVIAQLSPPDMKTPIQYALTYPERKDGCGKRLDLSRSFALHFEPPDAQRFPALAMAYQTAERSGDAGAVLNAANETAVAAFMAGRIAFGEISDVVQRTITGHSLTPGKELDDLLEADRKARVAASALIERRGASA
jgi:1-deoxy-D-xylulose-5-phosphate reductoisomerase